MNTPTFQFKLYVDKGRVINGGDSIFEVNSLIPLPVTHELLGLEKFWFQKWNWHAKIALKFQFEVSVTIIMIYMVCFSFHI